MLMNVVFEKKSMGGEMSFCPLVRPHRLWFHHRRIGNCFLPTIDLLLTVQQFVSKKSTSRFGGGDSCGWPGRDVVMVALVDFP